MPRTPLQGEPTALPSPGWISGTGKAGGSEREKGWKGKGEWERSKRGERWGEKENGTKGRKEEGKEKKGKGREEFCALVIFVFYSALLLPTLTLEYS